MDKFQIQPYRKLVQFGFLAIILLMAVQFAAFVSQLEKGIMPTVSRPPGVEGFLPIAAMISLKYWLVTGVFNPVHPAGLVLLLLILLSALLLKKGFCGWVCPFGLLSEYLARIHTQLFKKRWNLPWWLDYPLRGIKYFMMLFFVWNIMARMDLADLEFFMGRPYQKVMDIRMLKFFTGLSTTAGIALIIIGILTFTISYFWCRYLCPYGALLGGLSWLSPFKIHRNKETCIDCQKCTKVCPARVRVHTASVVRSDECHACLQCVDSCPVKDTLYLSVTKKKLRLKRLAYAGIIVLIFLLGITLARVGGIWQNNISKEEYLELIKHIDEPGYTYER